MADLNRWVNTQKRHTLNELRAEINTLRAAVDRDTGADGRGQRRMATRIETLIDLKLSALDDEEARERLERSDSNSALDIDEGLKA